MAIKKSELYSSLWESCDDLRGGMDASQYKDYVLVMLFIKYISDKYANKPFAEIYVPKGSSFADMVTLKGTSDIGDQINKRIIAPLAEANDQLSQADFPDFNDANKLGSGKEMVDRLTKLIATFQDSLDFSKNRAGGDDILGDAYEYLMRHFATESGKSKGQFYTPAEVSRVIAQVIGIGNVQTTSETSVYDPTCGSGSLLLKVADEAGTTVSLYGQEKDAATTGLARMNMILHNYPTAIISQGNTLADPKYKDGATLKTFDYVVANPPFSDKRWRTGLTPDNDDYERFVYGTPPERQGDYAYLLHILRSLKSQGKGACILPHGVLFRGNAEAEIRYNLVTRGFIKGIIGLPANLFYGTGIPACIVVLDKAQAATRTSVFMIDASGGFIKDGAKNRLRAMDIHKIVDTFIRLESIAGYSRMVSLEEIAANDYNLNIPRYIDNQQREDRQDIIGHLRGGIPQQDIDALAVYWQVAPSLKHSLFNELRLGYVSLAVTKDAIKTQILKHPEFTTFTETTHRCFEMWQKNNKDYLENLSTDCNPKEVIRELSESLLASYQDAPLINAYDVYQHFMSYWQDSMQDDLYLISADGWQKEKDKGWACDLIPKVLIVNRYFEVAQANIQDLEAQLESSQAELSDLEEEHSGDEGAFSELGKINKSHVKARLKELKNIIDDEEVQNERAALNTWLELSGQVTALKKQIKAAETALDDKAYAKYAELCEDDIKQLVIYDKWLATLATRIANETERVGQRLTARVRELAERYETPLPELNDKVAELEAKVTKHLNAMGYSWN